VIGLVGCVKSKHRTARPAGAMYRSPLFHGAREYVERSCERWLILSAHHGVLEPNEVIEPYDTTLLTFTIAEKREWSQRVVAQLQTRVSLEGAAFEIHAGQEYYENGLLGFLSAASAYVVIPTVDLPLGEKLQFYNTPRHQNWLSISDTARCPSRRCKKSMHGQYIGFWSMYLLHRRLVLLKWAR